MIRNQILSRIDELSVETLKSYKSKAERENWARAPKINDIKSDIAKLDKKAKTPKNEASKSKMNSDIQKIAAKMKSRHKSIGLAKSKIDKAEKDASSHPDLGAPFKKDFHSVSNNEIHFKANVYDAKSDRQSLKSEKLGHVKHENNAYIAHDEKGNPLSHHNDVKSAYKAIAAHHTKHGKSEEYGLN